MKIIPLNLINSVNFAFSDISVTYRTPQWTTLGDLNNHKRTVNGFLLIDRGSCHYEWHNGSSDLSKGGLIYLAIGSRKVITVTEKPFSYYNINFTMTDISDGEQIIFDANPIVISNFASEMIFDYCRAMLASTMSRNGIFKSTSLLCDLFHTILMHHTIKSDSRIISAVEYIERNYTENIDIEYLSNMCYLSQAHFFRLFKNEMRMSPIEYKNKLKLERAKALLTEDECSVSEVADILGFESVYYFSRFFKKYTGTPPSEYTSFIK